MTGTILPLVLKDVSYQVGKWRLIKDVTCAFEAGLRTVVIGPNGAGKSTLMRLCHGLLEPTSGWISWHGAEGREAARHQAMVFQRPVLLRRSVAANVSYALGLHDVPRRERRERTDEVLERTGLSRLAKRPARTLSASISGSISMPTESLTK